MIHNKFAEIYDDFMSHVDYTSWKKFISSYLKKGKLKIADLGSGTGKMAYLFAKNKNEVKAFDISEKMIEISKNKYANVENLEFIKADIINENIGKDYDLIMCNFDTINYFDSLQTLDKLFFKVNNSLKENGVFIFDLLEDGIFNEIFVDGRMEYKNKKYILKMFHKKIDTNRHNIEIFIKLNENGKLNEYREIHQKYIFDLKDVFELLNKNGFIIYDNARNKNYGESRLFVVCKKR